MQKSILISNSPVFEMKINQNVAMKLATLFNPILQTRLSFFLSIRLVFTEVFQVFNYSGDALFLAFGE